MDDYIGRAVHKLFPYEFHLLLNSYNRGRWTTQRIDKDGFEGGIWFNRVLLWKLQCSVHKDVNDFLCAITCGGYFVGGEFLAPDLKMKFRSVLFDLFPF